MRDFVIKYDKQLNLDRAKKTKSLDDRLSLAVDVAWQDLKREASERYKVCFFS